MKTLSLSSQRRHGYRLAAESIIDLFEDLRFTTDNAVDYIRLVDMITDIIQNRIEGNVNRNNDDIIMPDFSKSAEWNDPTEWSNDVLFDK